MTPDRLTLEAQAVLDDLWVERLIPFELTAHKVESLGLGEYIVRFYDSRLRSVDFSWTKPNSFQNAVRVATLARVARLSGPLNPGRPNGVTAGQSHN
jgi:hypothetical protein